MNPEEFVWCPELSVDKIVNTISFVVMGLGSNQPQRPKLISTDNRFDYPFYRWTIPDFDAREIIVILEYGDIGQPEMIEKSGLTVIAGNPGQGPACSDTIFHKHHSQKQVTTMLEALIEAACHAATLYDEQGVKTLKDWSLTRA